MSSPGLKLGILVDNITSTHTIRLVVTEAGMQVAATADFNRIKADEWLKTPVDAWIVSLNVDVLEEQAPDKVHSIFDSITVPMILCEGAVPSPATDDYNRWKRRMLEKLHALAGSIKLEQQEDYEIPPRIWVLAGSIGGPGAVKKFLDGLPGNLGIAFIYANHMEDAGQALLAQVMGQHSHYPAYIPAHGDVLQLDRVAVVSPDNVTTLMPNGTFNVSKEEWTGFYQPNLDYVIANITSLFGDRGGVIIFSGMCDDGAASCRLVKQHNGQVWIQRPNTCVSSAMPDAAEATGCVDFMGSPEELSAALVTWAQQKKSKVATV